MGAEKKRDSCVSLDLKWKESTNRLHDMKYSCFPKGRNLCKLGNDRWTPNLRLNARPLISPMVHYVLFFPWNISAEENSFALAPVFSLPVCFWLKSG